MEDYNLIVQNLVTGEIEVISDYSSVIKNSDTLASGLLYMYVNKYLENNIPFKVDFLYGVK